MKSKELFEQSKKYVPGGVHSPVRSFKGLHTTPRFINKANGAYIYDEEEKEYIDFCMSFGPMILGHRNQKVELAVTEGLKNGWSFGACEKYSLDLAQFIVNKIDFIEKIRFVNSGTEAVMTAIRLARGFTKKEKIIKFNGCYHGHTDSMLIKAGSGLAGTSTSSSSGVSEKISSDTLICELGNLNQLKEVINSHKNEVAAVFIEPLPANNGLLIQAESFLKSVQQICKENQILLVFDEVISGFRIGFGGMSEKLSIEPDIVTYGKIIGGGFPVGAVAAKAKIMDYLAPIGNVYQAGTLSANPIAMIAGLENLKQLDDEFYSNLLTQSNQVVSTLNEWMQKNGFEDYQIIQYESLFWPVPTHDKLITPSQIPENMNERFYKLFEVLLNKGIYLSPNGYEVGFVSIAHNNAVVEDLKTKLWS